MTRHMLLFLITATLLPACEDVLGGDTTPLLVATDQGRVIRLDANDEAATQAWTAEIPSGAAAKVLVSAGTVFAASGDQVAAFDLETGAARWSTPRSFGVTVVNVVGPIDGAIFALTFEDLVAVDAATGEEQWRLDLILADAADEAMAASAGRLVLAGDPIRSIDPATGTELQVYDTPDSDIRALAIDGGAVYAGLADGLVSLDASTLVERWKVDSTAQVDNLALGGGSVLYSVLGGGIAAVSSGGAAEGAAEDGEIFQHVAVDGDLFLGVRADGLLAAWDSTAFADCTLSAACPTAWEVPGSSATVDALAVGTDAVYYSSGGVLEAVTSAGGGSLWTYQAEGNVVAVVVP